MSKEFYDYTALHIISFFKTIEASMHKGERYFLKLDNQNMVNLLDNALYRLTGSSGIRGTWVYKHGVYDTYTLKLNHIEIAVISKTEDMTEDFLATLRNAKTTMLMITSAPIDSIKKGAGDLTAKGMPFHKDEIIKNIENYIENSPLSDSDRAVLHFELKRRNEDIFSDKSSLSEYENLLSIVGSEKVTPDNFGGFRLLYDDALASTSEKDQSDRLIDNNSWFERIDRSIRFGNVENDFEKYFDTALIRDLISRSKNPATWDEGLKYTDILKSIDKKKKIKEQPFEEIEHQVYANSPLEYRFNNNDNLFFRPDGTSASKQRKQSIVIFNSDRKQNIILELTFNRPVRKDSISCGHGQFSISGRTIVYTADRNDTPCSFHYIRIKDKNSDVKYEYRICIVDISPDYLRCVMTSYYVTIKRNAGFLRILGSSGDIIINSGRDVVNTVTISDGETYSCNFDSTLCLHIDENMMTDENQGINIILDLGGVPIPVSVVDEPKAKVLITGLQVWKKKYTKKDNFIVTGDNAIALGTDEFFTKEDFRQNLLYEQEFIQQGLYSATRSGTILSGAFVNLPDAVKEAYDEFLFYFRQNHLIPSLTYYSETLIGSAQKYVDSIYNCIKDIENGAPVSGHINDLLKLGVIYGTDDAREICLTPLHPINVMYQLSLIKETHVGIVRDEFASRLSCANFLPYIKGENKEVYRVMDQKHSQEWTYYAPVTNKRFKGARAFVPKLISEKIAEYIDHFSCLFSEIGNKTFRVNIINMGDCKEVLYGLIRFIAKSLQRNPDPDDLTEFVANIYGEQTHFNEFLTLSDINMLVKTYHASEVKFGSSFTEYDIANILSKKVKCFFHSEDEDKYEYSHIAFYEMDSNEEPSAITSSSITSGVMLNGIISGVPSVFYGNEYKTGFGTLYATDTPLLALADCYNSLHQVANTSNPYYKDQCMSTSVEKTSVHKMNKIYDSSNWVTFVDPKVDLNFFKNTEDSNLLIIHYSDQYTSSSGYDAITVTRKSKQYEDIINEYLTQKAVPTDRHAIHSLIDMFNAMNGDWLLRLISSNNYFPREKMSILAAVKTALAYYNHPNIIWVPISLEELLRVSGATGLSVNDGILSAKKLGFEDGKTSDDILLIGIEKIHDKIFVYLHPIEVKIGHTNTMTEKAKKQIGTTSKGLLNAMWPDEDRYSLQNKLVRNFIMQLTVISSEKMKLYQIWPEQKWDKILVEYRKDLLNENYEISTLLDSIIGRGSIIAFNHDTAIRSSRFEDGFEILDLTEPDGVNYIVRTVAQIQEDINKQSETFPCRLINADLSNARNLMKMAENHDFAEDVEPLPDIPPKPYPEDENAPEPRIIDDNDASASDDSVSGGQGDSLPHGIEILFGTNQSNGEKLIWEPGNTDEVSHPNTGIIGTMGTGKTQFTKSIITQLYREKIHNVNQEDIGILIFDYKGDYNENKTDFVTATNATVLKLYHLPYNPLALTKPKTFKSLLPIHVANAFKDTLVKAYALGPKQGNILFNCIRDAFSQRGIDPTNPSTWDMTPPTFSDVYRIYSNDDNIKKNDSLAAALDKLAVFEIFENDPAKTKSLFDLLHGVVVVDLSGYDSDIQNLVVAITLDLFYVQMQSRGSSILDGRFRQLTKMILVDEADNFLHEGFPSLRKILKEGREFGVGTILSTQFLKHFCTGNDDFAKYILTWVVHSVADLKPSDIRFVFNTEANSPQEQKLFNDVKRLSKHCSIVKMGSHTTPYYIRDKAFWELVSE